MSKKIFVATPTKWGINPYTHTSFSRNLFELGRNTEYELLDVRMYDEAPLDEARNKSVEDFLESEADLFMTYDADQTFPWGTFEHLLRSMEESEAQVMSGWYLARKGSGTIVVFRRSAEKTLGNYDDFSYYQPYTVRELLFSLPTTSTKWGTLVQVDGVGMGLIVIKREVLEDMKYPYFLQWGPTMKRDIHHFGEDLWFCDNLAKMGVPIHVNVKCYIGHWASQGFIVDETFLHQKMIREGLLPQDIS